MSNLQKIVENGELVVPSKDSIELFENMNDKQIKQLVNKGEVILSDGKGNAFLVCIPASVKETKEIEKDQITIIKIPYKKGYNKWKYY